MAQKTIEELASDFTSTGANSFDTNSFAQPGGGGAGSGGGGNTLLARKVILGYNKDSSLAPTFVWRLRW
jgi:hypothetical protein